LRPREVTDRAHLKVLSVYRDHGVVPKDSRNDNFNKTPVDLSRYQEVCVGDLVVNKMKAWQGSVAISKHHGIVSPDYQVCSVDPTVYSRFLHYLLRSSPLIAEYGARSKGIRPAQWRLYWEDLSDISVELPDVREQQRIADFLDAETARIDHMTRYRSAQVRLLEARRLAVISEVADHLVATYGRVRLRHLMLGVEQGWSPQCEDRLAEAEEWGVVKAGCVNGGKFQEDQHKALPADLTPRVEYRLRPGDLLMSRASGSPDLIGSVAVVPPGIRRLLLCDKIYRIHVDRRQARARFLALMLRTHPNREHIKLGISGAEGMANNLPTAVVKDCVVPDIPLDIQDAVIAEVEHRLSQVDDLQRLAMRQTDALSERRQALITAAVTGQFDVTTARGADLS
jgi:type I restriction enzyme S subunit